MSARLQLIFFILIIPLSIFSKVSYGIYSNGNNAGQSNIDYDYPLIKEEIIWTDGFSDEYSLSIHNFSTGYSYKCNTYIQNNSIPLTIQYKNNNLEKKSLNTKINIDFKNDIYFISNNSTPMSIIMFLILRQPKSIYSISYDDNIKVKYISGLPVKIGDLKVRVFTTGIYPDSVLWGSYIFKKQNNYSHIENPYSTNYSNIIKKDYFTKKKARKKIRIGNVLGELAFGKDNKEIVIILPFDYRSDRNGNMPNINAYTTYQMAEKLNKTTFIFDFKGFDKPNINDIKKSLKHIDEYFKKHYSSVSYIAFNDMVPLLLLTINDAQVIGINPPLNNYYDYQNMIFKKLNIYNNYIYTNLNTFIRYNPLDSLLKQVNFCNLYKESNELLLIFSKHTMTEKELKLAKSLNVEGAFINNIDRRLNSYIIKNDLWSFRKNPRIHLRIIDYINTLINKQGANND